MKKQDDRDKPTALEVAIERAYRKRDIPKFVRLIGKMLTISDNKDGAGGAKLFQYALTQLQKKKDDYNDLIMKGAIDDYKNRR